MPQHTPAIGALPAASIDFDALQAACIAGARDPIAVAIAAAHREPPAAVQRPAPSPAARTSTRPTPAPAKPARG